MKGTGSKNSFEAIESAARDVHIDLWRDRHALWKVVPSNPLDIAEPGVALYMLGYDVESGADLGETFHCGRRTKVAGLIDNRRKIVRISAGPDRHTQMFTAGHELGHAVLHPDLDVLHRDISMERVGVASDPREAQANRFSSAFLIPRRILVDEFERRFGSAPFELSVATGFELFGRFDEKVLEKVRGVREIGLKLACAISYSGKHFHALHSAFGVSPLMMAIRLEELQLMKGYRY